MVFQVQCKRGLLKRKTNCEINWLKQADWIGRKCMSPALVKKLKWCMFCFIYRFSSSEKQLSSDDFNIKKLINNLPVLKWKRPVFSTFKNFQLGLNWKTTKVLFNSWYSRTEFEESKFFFLLRNSLELTWKVANSVCGFSNL